MESIVYKRLEQTSLTTEINKYKGNKYTHFDSYVYSTFKGNLTGQCVLTFIK